jgi:hypothetical protein
MRSFPDRPSHWRFSLVSTDRRSMQPTAGISNSRRRATARTLLRCSGWSETASSVCARLSRRGDLARLGHASRRQGCYERVVHEDATPSKGSQHAKLDRRRADHAQCSRRLVDLEAGQFGLCQSGGLGKHRLEIGARVARRERQCSSVQPPPRQHVRPRRRLRAAPLRRKHPRGTADQELSGYAICAS